MAQEDQHLVRLAAVAKQLKQITSRDWNHNDLLELLHDHHIEILTKRGRKHPEYLSDAIHQHDADALCDKLTAEQSRD